MRAAVYLRITRKKMVQSYMDYYKERIMSYCMERNYNVLIVIELIDLKEEFLEYGKEKIKELAEGKMVDVIVVPLQDMISDSETDIREIKKRLSQAGVFLDFIPDCFAWENASC